jgi:ComEC/Rec2-related protein
MGKADGLLFGSALLTGVLLGWPALLLVPSIAAVIQFSYGRIVLPRILLCTLLAGIGALRAPESPTTFSFDEDVLTSSSAVGQVVSVPRAATGGQRFLFDVEAVLIDDEWRTTSFTALLTLRGSDLNIGDTVWIAWSLSAPEDVSPSFLTYLHGEGADTTAAVFAGEVQSNGTSIRRPFGELQQAVSEFLRGASPGDAGALLAGLVTGDDSALSNASALAFQRTGTTHITAVSGSNLALVAALWTVLGTAAGWRRRWWLSVAIVVSVWIYAGVVGFEPPATRAAAVVSLAVLGMHTGRRPDALTLVIVAAAAMALTDPAMTRSLSFQLSLVTSAALVTCLPRRPEAGPAAWLRGAIAGVVCAQFAALPLLIASFGVWTPLSIPANLAILPLVTPTFTLAFVAAIVGLGWPAAGTLIAELAAIGATWIVEIVVAFGRIALPVPFGRGSHTIMLLVTTLSMVVVGAMSRDIRRWSNDISATQSSGDRVPVITLAAFCGGTLVGIVGVMMLR